MSRSIAEYRSYSVQATAQDFRPLGRAPQSPRRLQSADDKTRSAVPRVQAARGCAQPGAVGCRLKAAASTTPFPAPFPGRANGPDLPELEAAPLLSGNTTYWKQHLGSASLDNDPREAKLLRDKSYQGEPLIARAVCSGGGRGNKGGIVPPDAAPRM